MALKCIISCHYLLVMQKSQKLILRNRLCIPSIPHEYHLFHLRRLINSIYSSLFNCVHSEETRRRYQVHGTKINWNETRLDVHSVILSFWLSWLFVFQAITYLLKSGINGRMMITVPNTVLVIMNSYNDSSWRPQLHSLQLLLSIWFIDYSFEPESFMWLICPKLYWNHGTVVIFYMADEA